MHTVINLYSPNQGEINRFLCHFYDRNFEITKQLKWEKEYENPIEMADMIGSFIDNNDRYKINMWISIDPGFFINVTDYNADDIIRYLYERFPY